jgi:hypothetical protein
VPLTWDFGMVHPTGQYSKKYPQVEGHVLHLSARHAKLRREGYRKQGTDDALDRFHNNDGLPAIRGRSCEAIRQPPNMGPP